MSRYRSDVELGEYDKPTGCRKCLHYTWKTITCLLSHITLVSVVISYCALGGFMFAALEHEKELEVKRNISAIRLNVTNKLWKLTLDSKLLYKENFTLDTLVYLEEFEKDLLDAMIKQGWNGDEDEDRLQWTFTGALFYSIIVITTIGYGHIAPKTTWGKVSTIFYAILGIPLMLLCLSNIGDIMATSFRFLYWKVCCYVCTKKPKKRRSKSRTSSRMTISEGRFSRSRNASFRRSMRTSTRSADSGFPLTEMGQLSHSDTDLRYQDNASHHYNRSKRGSSMPRLRQFQQTNQHQQQQQQRHLEPSSSSMMPTLPRKNPNNIHNNAGGRVGGSLDRRKYPKGMLVELDPDLLSKTSILCNRYVVGRNDLADEAPGITRRDNEGLGKAGSPMAARRARSMPKTQNFLQPPPRFPAAASGSSPRNSAERDVDSPRVRPAKKKKSPPPHNPSPKMMTPLGYGHRSKYLDDPDSDSDDDHYYYSGDDDEYYEMARVRTRPVPIWLCVFLVVSYIIAGAFLFTFWENWKFFDAAYFCFITLTTIGFGDFVPAKGVNKEIVSKTGSGNQDIIISIALCSLYLLFGIALLAMSFNLVQEEVISNVRSIAKTLGIIKKNEDDDDDES